MSSPPSRPTSTPSSASSSPVQFSRRSRSPSPGSLPNLNTLANTPHNLILHHLLPPHHPRYPHVHPAGAQPAQRQGLVSHHIPPYPIFYSQENLEGALAPTQHLGRRPSLPHRPIPVHVGVPYQHSGHATPGQARTNVPIPINAYAVPMPQHPAVQQASAVPPHLRMMQRRHSLPIGSSAPTGLLEPPEFSPMEGLGIYPSRPSAKRTNSNPITANSSNVISVVVNAAIEDQGLTSDFDTHSGDKPCHHVRMSPLPVEDGERSPLSDTADDFISTFQRRLSPHDPLRSASLMTNGDDVIGARCEATATLDAEATALMMTTEPLFEWTPTPSTEAKGKRAHFTVDEVVPEAYRQWNGGTRLEGTWITRRKINISTRMMI
ncbi:hypothetical protein BC829DRAFT_251989 [Chytridium lagenaria]|nr:hypothetical protein BC829DRAFT_251989 [Chytridium lagenaria]